MRNKEKGFTVVEFLIYMLIFSMMTLILVQVFGSTLDALLESQSKSGVLSDGEYITARFSYDIKRAADVVIPEEIGQTGNTLTINIDGEDYTYSLSGGDFVLSNNSGSDKLNSFDDNVENLNFTHLGYEDGKSLIYLSFDLKSKILLHGNYETKNFKTTVGIR